MSVQQSTVDIDEFTSDWHSWHRQHEARLADPHGFLTITNLHWLGEQPQRFPDAPGSWSTGSGGVTVDLDDGEELLVDGVTAQGRHAFGVIPERGGAKAVWGDAVIEVANRGGHNIVRPRHPNTPLRTAFTGTPAYPPRPRWVVNGRYVPFAEPRPTTVGAAVEGLEHVYDAPGRVEFRLHGQFFSLTAFPGQAPGSLIVLFTDGTSGVTTYAASRASSAAAMGRGRDRGAGLQPSGEPAVRLHRSGHLPAAAGGEPAASRDRGRREDPLRAPLNPRRIT